MLFELNIPSDDKVLTDPVTGAKFSKREVTHIASMVSNSASLIKFGDDINNKWKNTGHKYLVYDNGVNGKGYIVYEEKEDCVYCHEIYTDSEEEIKKNLCYESLVFTLFNIGKSVSKKMSISNDDSEFESLIDKYIQLDKENKVEEIYRWKKK